MQNAESLRELIWNPEVAAGLPELVLSLGIAALLAVILEQAYISPDRSGSGWQSAMWLLASMSFTKLLSR